MSNKRFVLKPGFLIKNQKMIPCHFCNVTTEGLLENQVDKLVLADGVVELVEAYRGNVFSDKAEAIDNLKLSKKGKLSYLRKQYHYYEKLFREAREEEIRDV